MDECDFFFKNFRFFRVNSIGPWSVVLAPSVGLNTQYTPYPFSSIVMHRGVPILVGIDRGVGWGTFDCFTDISEHRVWNRDDPGQTWTNWDEPGRLVTVSCADIFPDNLLLFVDCHGILFETCIVHRSFCDTKWRPYAWQHRLWCLFPLSLELAGT